MLSCRQCKCSSGQCRLSSGVIIDNVVLQVAVIERLKAVVKVVLLKSRYQLNSLHFDSLGRQLPPLPPNPQITHLVHSPEGLLPHDIFQKSLVKLMLSSKLACNTDLPFSRYLQSNGQNLGPKFQIWGPRGVPPQKGEKICPDRYVPSWKISRRSVPPSQRYL